MALMSVLSFAHKLVEEQVQPGDAVIDATIGNGVDTCFLAERIGLRGTLYGFDVQTTALEATAERLRSRGLLGARVQLIHSGHEQMVSHVNSAHVGKIAAAMFNLGYLPGADIKVITRTATTIPALEQALSLLRVQGILTVVLYPGHEGGAEEAEAVSAWAKSLPGQTYDVVRYESWNRIKQPPYLLAVSKKS